MIKNYKKLKTILQTALGATTDLLFNTATTKSEQVDENEINILILANEIEKLELNLETRVEDLETDVELLKLQIIDVLDRLGNTESDIAELITRVDQIDIEQLIQDENIQTLFDLINGILNSIVNIQGTSNTPRQIINGNPVITDILENDNPQNTQYDGTNFIIKGTTNVVLTLPIGASINDNVQIEIYNVTKTSQLFLSSLKVISKNPDIFSGQYKLFITAGTIDIDDVINIRYINSSTPITALENLTVSFDAGFASNVDLSNYYTKTESDAKYISKDDRVILFSSTSGAINGDIITLPESIDTFNKIELHFGVSNSKLTVGTFYKNNTTYANSRFTVEDFLLSTSNNVIVFRVDYTNPITLTLVGNGIYDLSTNVFTADTSKRLYNVIGIKET